jgi:spermidine/putrescine-binding protein
MKKLFSKGQFAALVFFCAALMGFTIPTASAETLRILEWGFYMPESAQKQIIKIAKDKYGVDLKLEIKAVNGNDDFFPALKGKTADVIAPSHNVPRDERYRLIKHKLVLPLNLDNIPNYKNVDAGLQKADYCTEGGVVYGVPIARGPYGLAYNTAIVTEAPKSWNIFWDPQYKGKYSIGKHQYEENIFSVALAMGYSKNDISNYKKLNNPEFQKKLAEFIANAGGMWEGSDKPEDLKGLAFATSWGDSLNALKDIGEVWVMAEPKEGTTAWVDNIMISHTLKDKPKLKQIAEELANIIISDDNQIEYANGGGTPVTSSIMDKLSPEIIKRAHLDDPDYFKNNMVLWPTLNKTDRKGLKRLWDKALKQSN